MARFLRRRLERARLWGAVAALALACVLIGFALLWPVAPPAPLDAQRQAPAQAPPSETGAAQASAPRLAPPAQPAPSGQADAAFSPPPMPPAGLQAWQRYAVPAPAPDHRPCIAIVIDDLGVDKARTRRTIALPGPLTVSFLPYASDLPRQAAAARRNGHELLVHVPMEPVGHLDMGPNGLETGLAREEVVRRLRWDLARFDGYVGVNNHMGSKFTSDARSMAIVIEELKARGLLFLDSRTTAGSVGASLALRDGVPSASRDVFLDNVVDAAAIAARLAEVEVMARRQGHAIAIGHPHDATLDALAPWLASLPRKGFVLVPVSAIVRESWARE